MWSAHGTRTSSMAESQRKPLAFTKCPLGGANRITIDPARFDLAAPSPFDGIVEPDHDGSIGRQEGVHQHLQKMAGDGAGRPRCSIKDTVEGTKVAIAIAPQDAQRGRDRAPARRQNGTGKQHDYV